MFNNSSCAVSSSLANNTSFVASVYVLLLMALVSAILNVLLMVILKRAKHLDQNVCFLLINMSFAASLMSFYQLFKAIYVSIKVTQPCGLLMNILTCKLVEVVYLSSGLGVIWSAFAMGIDRLVATKKPDSYIDDWGRIIPTFISTSWVVAVVAALLIATLLDDNGANVAHCNIIFVIPLILEIPLGLVTVATEIVLATLFTCLWLYNRRYLKDFGSNKATGSLRARFQLHRNMRAARMMLPSVAVHCCMWMIIASSGVAARLSQMSPVDFFIVGQYGSDGLVLLHTLLHPLICFAFNTELKLELKLFLGYTNSHHKESLSSNEATRPLKEPDQKTHFDLLTKSWDHKK